MRNNHPTALAAMIALALTSIGQGQPAPSRETPPAASPDPRPNIVFIMADDHGYQAISAYGHGLNETPNIDRIGETGTRFDRAFVTNSLCGPSRAVILTGLHSHLNGFMRNGNIFDPEQRTAPKMLRAAGYQTALIGKWHLKSDPTGFDYYDRLIGQGPYYNPAMIRNGERIKREGYTTDIITQLADDWLREGRDDSDGAKPFFVMIHHKAPHRNWQPAPRFLQLYDGADIPEPATLFDDWSGKGPPAREQEMTVANHLSRFDLKLDEPKDLTPDQLAAWKAAYDPKNAAFEAANLEGDDLVRWQYQRYAKDYLRCIAAVDEGVGTILDTLDELGLAENTIVIYTSDQGWFLGDHGWYDKRWMYEESFRTPLLVRWPGQTGSVGGAGTVSTTMVQNLDYAPTFLDAAGVEIPEDMQGRSLRPVMGGATPDDWRTSLYYQYFEYPAVHMVAKHRGIRTDRYKLIEFYERAEGDGRWELYDLQEDPDEMHNVAGTAEYERIETRLRGELVDLIAEVGAQDAGG
ncbi:MAG: arylsulfatase A-like enzyme [Phycisphaerales bacterium]|jgi:arylsulfatase A-like enzyme